MYKPGDKVEVSKIWAYNSFGSPPFREWFGGYTVVKVFPNVIRVISKAGIVGNYNKKDIRKE